MRYWKRVDINGNTITVESYSHDLNIKGAFEITKEEFDLYIASLPLPVITPLRDLALEIDEIKTRIAILEKR